MISLNLIVPCFNEDEVLPQSAEQLTALLKQMVADGDIDASSHITFVDDGSSDRTWEIISGLVAASPALYRGIKFSANRGHQIAILAGLLQSRADAAITIDADLQDDLKAIPEMVRAHAQGNEIVYGVRSFRTSDTWFKRKSAEWYYKLLSLFGVDIVFNHADFRLMGKRAINALRKYSETNLFLRGLIPQLGFKSTNVYYARGSRMAGVTKYPLRKMVSLALKGITSFSVYPLRMITILGVATSVIAFVIGVWAIVAHLTDVAIPGWPSIVAPIMFVSGLQIFSLGVIGEYVGRIYLETKRRPLFEIEESIGGSGTP